jgi:hypothetical protein
MIIAKMKCVTSKQYQLMQNLFMPPMMGQQASVYSCMTTKVKYQKTQKAHQAKWEWQNEQTKNTKPDRASDQRKTNDV